MLESTLVNTLNTLDKNYAAKQLHADQAKMRVNAFHLKNQEAKCELNISWLGTKVNHSTDSV